MIVMENPMQFTIVKDAPLDSSGAFCATSVEKRGESAMTTSPQKKRKATIAKAELFNKKNGERIQQHPDRNNEIAATFFVPKNCEMDPLTIQARLPDPIIKKDKNGVFSVSAALCFCQFASITGTNAQNAYNSHIWPK